MVRKLKTILFKVLFRFIASLPGRKCIVFESIPNLSDSPKAVFDEFVKRGYGNKYKLVWWLYGDKKPSVKPENCIYVDTSTLLGRCRLRWHLLHAPCLISCNRFLETHKSGQTSLYITHGTVIKQTGAGYNLPKNIDYVVVASEHVREVMAWDLAADVNKFYGLGYPRNDILQKADRDLHPMFPVDYQKIVVWYPTFRQHKNGFKTGTQNALPILHNADNAQRLNEIAKRNKVLLVVKPHFAQDLSYIKDCHLSHIQFINDSFFEEHQISSYEFVGSCDALITDYSSIYYDFLLCDKPVAAIWEDIDEYRMNPGFAVDVDYYVKGAEKIYNLDDFEAFIDRLARGVDMLRNERAEINALVNYSTDGKNAERVVDFIIEKANL
jgi:CDP-glycerol glycerophosphotransferase (TagB/SpsB family)